MSKINSKINSKEYQFQTLNSLQIPPTYPKISLDYPAVQYQRIQEQEFNIDNAGYSTSSSLSLLSKINIQKKSDGTILKPILPPPPPPPPPPPKNPNFLAGQILRNAYVHFINNSSSIENTIISSAVTEGQSFHTPYDDQIKLNNLNSKLNEVNGVLNVQALKDANNNKSNIDKDIATSKILKNQIDDYYNITLPNYHKQSEVEVLNNQIYSLKTSIDELTIKNNYIVKEITITNNSTSLNKNIQNDIIKTNSELLELNKVLKGTNSKNKILLYNDIVLENNVFEKELERKKINSDSNVKKSDVLLDKTSWLILLKNGLFLGYYVLIVGLIYVLFILNGTNENFKLKVFCFILLIIYPLIIGPLESYFLYVFKLLFSFLSGYLYKDPKTKYISSISDSISDS
jgi:hypothetical protein